MPRGHRFKSRAQWRAMHARYGHRGWVKRWSKGWNSLPARKGRKRGRRGRRKR